MAATADRKSMLNLDLDIQELQMRKVFVATPMYGGQCTGMFAKSCIALSQLFAEYGIAVQFSFLSNESLIPRARNHLVDEFLRSDCTHLMFVDGDIAFDPLHVLVLLAQGKDIVGGPYPKKYIAWESIRAAVQSGLADENANSLERYVVGDYVFNLIPGTTQFRPNEPVEVLEMGTGFMMIKREVFGRFLEAFPDHRYLPDDHRPDSVRGVRMIGLYFDCRIDPITQRYLSEDYYFCQKVRQAGMSTWLCPWMQLRHVGAYVFCGSLLDSAQLDMKRGNETAKICTLNPGTGSVNE